MPFRPSCSLCVSDCDGTSLLTSCQHFLCSRCFNKYPKGTCPRCQKPCKTILLSAPNVPREMMDRLQYDVRKHLSMAVQSLELQQRFEQSASQRLKEMIVTFNQQLKQSNQQLGETQRMLQHKVEECKTLQVEVNVLREQLREVHTQNRVVVTNIPPSGAGPYHHQTTKSNDSSNGFSLNSNSATSSGFYNYNAEPQQKQQQQGGGRMSAPPTPFFNSPSGSHAGGGGVRDGRDAWSPCAPQTPLGWARGVGPNKRQRDGTEHSEQQPASNNNSSNTIAEERFQLSTPMPHLGGPPLAQLLRDSPLVAASASRLNPKEHHLSSQMTSSLQMPKLQSLLPAVTTMCTARVVHGGSGHNEDDMSSHAVFKR